MGIKATNPTIAHGCDLTPVSIAVWTFASHVWTNVGTNLEARLAGRTVTQTDTLNAGSLVYTAAIARMKAWIGRLFGRRRSNNQ